MGAPVSGAFAIGCCLTRPRVAAGTRRRTPRSCTTYRILEASGFRTYFLSSTLPTRLTAAASMAASLSQNF